MTRKILMLEEGAATTLLSEVLADNEFQLQEQLKANPELLPIEEFDMTGPMMVVGRETTLASGSVDLLGLSRSGDLLIIEFKTGPQNSDFRHVLAQLLDYGGHLWGRTVEEFDSSVLVPYFTGPHCPSHSPTYGAGSLETAVQKSWTELSESEPEAIRERLKSQLTRGDFTYVIVAQRFTERMEKTMAYMNQIASPARFFGVEMVRFRENRLTAFEVRTVVKPSTRSSASATTSATNETTFLDAFDAFEERTAAQELLRACRGLGLKFEWGTVGTSIRLPVADRSEPVSVGWFFPPRRAGWMGLTNLSLGYDPSSAKAAPSALPHLETYLETVSKIETALPITSNWLQAVTFDSRGIVRSYTEIIEILRSLVASTSAQT